MRAVTASAPGKLILAGEHAVVHGRPALVAALDRRLAARFESLDGDPGWVEIEIPPLGLSLRLPWAEIASYAEAARARWQAWAAQPSAAAFAGVRGDDPAHLVKVALGEAAAWANASAEPHHASIRPPGRGDRQVALPSFRLTVSGDLPVGSGFGSSASAAVAVVAGFARFLGREKDPAAIEALALAAERRQHGLPSGVDGATVLHGGLRWAERGPGGELVTSAVSAPSSHLTQLLVFHTGPPPESTGAVVAAVRDRLAAEPRRIEALFDRIAEATVALREALTGECAGLETLREILSACHRALLELGVVPRPVAQRIAAIEAAGGAAKISGAGSLAGPAAGSLLVVHPDPERLAASGAVAGLERMRVRLGGPGLAVALEPAENPSEELGRKAPSPVVPSGSEGPGRGQRSESGRKSLEAASNLRPDAPSARRSPR